MQIIQKYNVWFRRITEFPNLTFLSAFISSNILPVCVVGYFIRSTRGKEVIYQTWDDNTLLFITREATQRIKTNCGFEVLKIADYRQHLTNELIQTK